MNRLDNSTCYCSKFTSETTLYLNMENLLYITVPQHIPREFWNTLRFLSFGDIDIYNLGMADQWF